MGLDGMWQQGTHAAHQVWAWLRYEVSVQPFLFLAAVIVIVAAFIMYKTEVRNK